MPDREKLEQLVERLRAERDELRVKMHLASMEAKDEWDEMEKKWAGVEERLGKAKDNVVEASRGVGEGVDVVAEEIKAAYRRIRDRLGEG